MPVVHSLATAKGGERGRSGLNPELDLLPVALAHLGVDGVLHYANPAWRELFGVTADVSSLAWLELLDPAARATLLSSLHHTSSGCDLVLIQGGHEGRYLRLRGNFDPGRRLWLTAWSDESVLARADQALGNALLVAHEAREEVESIFNAAAEAMLMVDCSSLRILRSNPAAAELYGYPSRYLDERPVADLVAGVSQAGDFIRLHRDYVPLRFHRRADGSHIAVEIRIRYCLRNGRELAILTVRDASERTRRDGALLESDLRYRAVFDSAPFPILLVSAQGCVLDANPAATSLYRFAREDILGRRAVDLMVADATLPRLFLARPTFLPASLHLRKDGTQFYAETTISYIHLRGSQVAILLVQDLTDSRQTLARLEESEERWRFALEGHGDALWDWTVNTGEITLSPAFRAIIGWPGDKPLLGSDVWPERLHPNDLRMVISAFNAHLHGARPITDVEFRLRMEDGSYRWVALRGKVMERDPEGKPLRMLGTLRDVHDRYLGAEREKRQQRDLAHAARLIHVGEMASALAHELNQPLTALRNFSAVAVRRLDELGAAGGGVREPLRMIAEQALRAGEIVHRVRGFVRKGGLVAVPVGINTVVLDIVRFTEFEARAHGVRCVLELADPIPNVLADQVQLEQVLSNLVKNGIEAMSAIEGERILTIITRPGEDGTVEVAVTDRGEGLAEAVQSAPFTPFVTTKPDGVGLGLAICRTIVENHGGRLWVDSSTREGTTFCFCLPSLAG